VVSVAYDSVRREVLLSGDSEPELMGGLWAYAPLRPASYQTFGAGCHGITLRPERLPWIGDRVHVRVEGIARSPVALLHLGFSKTVSGPYRLPLDLTAIGMPGCQMLTSADASFLLPVTAGAAIWAHPLGNDAQTLGIDFYNQAIVLDLLANPTGLAVSNGGEGRAGAR
jgi:hypothetical protein